jgi:hypothetical protein
LLPFLFFAEDEPCERISGRRRTLLLRCPLATDGKERDRRAFEREEVVDEHTTILCIVGVEELSIFWY